MDLSQNEDRESVITIEDFPFICRICCKKRSDLRVFEEEGFLFHLFHAIRKTDVRSTAKYPRNICNDCTSKVEEIHYFINISKKNNKVTVRCKNTMLNHKLMEYDDEIESVMGQKSSITEEREFHISSEESQSCRICSSSSRRAPFEEKIHLMDLFQNITNIDLRTETNSSEINNICNKCIDNLEEISSFINLSLLNDDKFENIIGGSEFKTESDSNPTVLVDDDLADIKNFNDIRMKNIGNELATSNEQSYQNGLEFHFQALSEKASGINGTVITQTYVAQTNEQSTESNEKFEAVYIKEEFMDSEFAAFTEQDSQFKFEIAPLSVEIPLAFIKKELGGESQPPVNPQYLDNGVKMTENEEMDYKCNSCNIIFAQKSYFQIHLRTHQCERPFKCDRCEKSFTQRSYLKKHLLTHTGKRPFECDCCTKCFSNKTDLKRHSLIHTGEKPYKCDHCEKRFTQSSGLQQHVMIHTGERPFKCNCCDKGYTTKSHLQKHMAIHTGEKFQCLHCESSFTQKTNLKHHLLVHNSEKPFKCGVCDKSFSQKSYLNKHSLIHTAEKLYECDKCTKKFFNKTDLRRHSLIHTGEKLYKCDLCEKRFTQPSSLQQHMLVHSGEKRFKCDHCEKEFSRKGYLRQHLLTHGEKQFKCDCCTMSFSRKSSLKQHLLIHNEGKQYECDLCDKSFNHSSSLQRHVLNHTTERSFKCDQCEKRFTRKDYLREHLLIHK